MKDLNSEQSLRQEITRTVLIKEQYPILRKQKNTESMIQNARRESIAAKKNEMELRLSQELFLSI